MAEREERVREAEGEGGRKTQEKGRPLSPLTTPSTRDLSLILKHVTHMSQSHAGQRYASVMDSRHRSQTCPLYSESYEDKHTQRWPQEIPRRHDSITCERGV